MLSLQFFLIVNPHLKEDISSLLFRVKGREGERNIDVGHTDWLPPAQGVNPQPRYMPLTGNRTQGPSVHMETL